MGLPFGRRQARRPPIMAPRQSTQETLLGSVPRIKGTAEPFPETSAPPNSRLIGRLGKGNMTNRMKWLMAWPFVSKQRFIWCSVIYTGVVLTSLFPPPPTMPGLLLFPAVYLISGYIGGRIAWRNFGH